ncbi:cupin domain-containing protein [Pseudorhodoplanes sp.]|uniref:cupin domain-containing protein n=1 Tax=Pseudorhodoplanes sp. TaxID=1934341 RepID=UPI003918EFE8
MPKIDLSRCPVRTNTIYPAEFARITQGREKQALGNDAGLTQFGVNLTRLKPGAGSSQRHWHETEDEFVYILDGEVTLVEDNGETILRAGDCAGFKAGVPNGHCLINRSQSDVVYLEIGTRAPSDRFHYPDIDMKGEKDEHGVRLTRKNGAAFG